MSILFQQVDAVAILTLNRPDKYNSFNTEMSRQLQGYLRTCADDDSVRAILLNAAGKGFCAGQDLGEFPDPANIDFAKIVSENYNPLILQIRALPKPVIAAVNGIAAGAGANLALACDLVIASENSSFLQAFSKISLIPDSGGTWILPRLIGMQRAAALMFTADKVSAHEAQAMGMIYRTYPAEGFEEAALAFATQLSQMPTQAIAHTKHLLNQSFTNTLEQQLEAEKEWQVASGKLDDFKEGVQAFLEKRTARFSGK